MNNLDLIAQQIRLVADRCDEQMANPPYVYSIEGNALRQIADHVEALAQKEQP